LITGCDTYQSQPQSNTSLPKASNPNPTDGAKGVSPYIRLTWTANENAVSFDIHFGVESPPPFVRNQTETAFDPGPLDWDTTYYWRIDTQDAHQGDIWKFTTFWYGDPNAEEMDVRFENNDPKKIVHFCSNTLAQRPLNTDTAAFTGCATQGCPKKKDAVAFLMQIWYLSKKWALRGLAENVLVANHT
jgi:hypothetical protein